MGCSSLATLSVGNEAENKGNCKPEDYVPRIYSGIFNDIRLANRIPPGETLIWLTDFPFSFIVDTAVLPYTIPAQIVWGNICPPPEKEQ